MSQNVKFLGRPSAAAQKCGVSRQIGGLADDAADGKSIGDGVNVAMRFEVTAMEELEKGNTFNKESAEML